MKLLLLRRYFITGLLVLVPALITLYIVVGAFNFMHSAIGQHIDSFLRQFLPFQVPGIGVVVSLAIVILVGVLASTVIGNRLFRFGEHLVTKVPIAKEIYPAAKQIIEFMISPKDPSFRQVVAVPFPMKGHYAVGFQTGDAPSQIRTGAGEPMVSVFIPHSPSPITGFTVVMPLSDVIPLDMTTEEAVKFIVSAGVLSLENGESVESGLGENPPDAL
ncbi:MAG: DUF502 domain-containing protein [Armatimonadetes bacterium]|nr:DUF502 domain-containing protein [Armatimonadota bacterium]